MTARRSLVAKLPKGEAISLGRDEVQRLVAALWGVSATRGAVVAIGKFEHRLVTASADSQLEVSELEAAAIRAALESEEVLTPALARLREATG